MAYEEVERTEPVPGWVLVVSKVLDRGEPNGVTRFALTRGDSPSGEAHTYPRGGSVVLMPAPDPYDPEVRDEVMDAPSLRARAALLLRVADDIDARMAGA